MATVAQKLAKRQGDYIRASTVVPITVTAVANTDFSFTLPPGAIDASYRLITTTAFGAATDAQLSLGKTSGAADLVAAVSAKALQVTNLTQVAAQAADHLNPPSTIFGRIAQTGTASATGAATLIASYLLPVS